MSNQADPFRQIVKENIHLIRDSEETREKNFQTGSLQFKMWNVEHEAYVRAAVCFARTENLDFHCIGINDFEAKKYFDDVAKEKL